MYQQQYRFTLTGLGPAIMHWDNIEWTDIMEEQRSKIKSQDKKNFKAGDDRCPPHTWKGYTYNDGEHIAIPHDNLRSCLMKAGARVELQGKKTYKELTQCAILFDDLYIDFFVDGKKIPWKPVEAISGTFAEQCATARSLGFRLFAKRAAVGQAKHIRVRPRFENWTAQGTFTVVDEQMKLEVLKKIWQIGGLYIGLLDWRPGSPKSPGPYGRFSVEVEKA